MSISLAFNILPPVIRLLLIPDTLFTFFFHNLFSFFFFFLQPSLCVLSHLQQPVQEIPSDDLLSSHAAASRGCLLWHGPQRGSDGEGGHHQQNGQHTNVSVVWDLIYTKQLRPLRSPTPCHTSGKCSAGVNIPFLLILCPQPRTTLFWTHKGRTQHGLPEEIHIEERRRQHGQGW